MKAILTAILSTALSVFSAETPDQLRDKGFEALKAAQADENKIVEAARFLAQAAEAYEKDGNDNAATELNSYLYWCKKKMTIKQMDAFLASGNGVARAAVSKMEAIEKKEVKPEDAAIWLAKADGFAEASKDPFLSAIRYFEVADRFVGAQESLIAQRKSLDLMGKLRTPINSVLPKATVGAPVSGFSPVGEWDFVRLSDGRTYQRTFRADHTFVTANLPLPNWVRGTWEMAGGVLILRYASGVTQSHEVLDRNTMVRGDCTLRRVLTPDRR